VVLKISILLTFALITSVAHAHDSPSHTIDELSRHTHLTSDQLHQRAIAHRATGHTRLAIADLQAAIREQPSQLGLHLELARTQLSAKHPTEVLKSTQQALKLATTPTERATIHILRAEAYQLDKKPKLSLSATQLAFREIPEGKIEWYLLRSENQRVLELKNQRVTDLETGLNQHPSAVLRSHWIDALIDAAQYTEALREVDLELTDRRWKSSYLIKRARALTGLHRKKEAAADLQSALAEIAPRIHPTRPDLLLLADQARAHAMLGNDAEAQATLKQLREHHAPEWILRGGGFQPPRLQKQK